MSDYIVCVRNVKRNGFGNEPGIATFLEVKNNQATYSPNERMVKSEWIKAVLEEAKTGVDDITGQDVGNILVFVHGYNNSIREVRKRHKELKNDLKKYGYKGALISFDWPSDRKAINYLEDRNDAKQSAFKLVKDCIALFAKLQRPDCSINTHILGFSTGAYVVREAFDDADDRPAIAQTNWTVSQVLFLEADVSSRSMSETNAKSSSLYRHCVRLTNYYNPHDKVLKLSDVKRIGVAPRAGRCGLPDNKPVKAVDINCGIHFKNNKAKIEANGGDSHNWSVDNEIFLKDVVATLAGDLDRFVIETREIRNGKLILK
ncbi:MAG: alpha/beta hydrolase [Calditrichia bacterium]